MPERKRNFRWVKWLLFLVLIVVAVVVTVLVLNNFNKKTNDNAQQATTTEDKTKKKETDSEKTENKEGTSEQEEKAPQYEGESPNKSETLTGIITYADIIDNDLVIRVNIDQFLSGGNCNLTMNRNGVTYYTQTASIQESVTTSTCDGYNIPVSELPKGDFSVEINLDSDGKSGKITGRVRI